MNGINARRSINLCFLSSLAFCGLASTSLRVVAADASSSRSQSPTSEIERTQARAERGSIKDELKMATNYYVGLDVQRDLAQSAQWFLKAAEHGDPGSQLRMGYLYLFGVGVPRDVSAAAKWFSLAASSGSSVAKLDIGLLYLNGTGVHQDISLGRQLIEQLAQKGDPRAMAYLGDMYYFGVGVPMNHATGEAWMLKAAKQNDAKAEYSLGALYSKVPNEPHDFPKAASYLRQAVDQGHLEAAHDLGLLLLHHSELAKTTDEPVELFQTAAQGGVWRSSVMLGILERDGLLVPKDERVAYRWFRIASTQGGAEAARLVNPDLQRLAAALGEYDQAAAEDESSAWLATHKDVDVLRLRRQAGEIPIHWGANNTALHAGMPGTDTEVVN